jgi:thioesterase domain-containing protein
VRCELLDYPDIDRPSAEISNLQLLVSQILQRIEAIYPSGPIYLAGYSLGGVIGLEVARRLAAAGRTPAFFGVLDTFVDRQRRRELHSWFWLQESTRDGPLWFLQSSVIILLINMGQVELVRAFILSLQRRYGRHRAQSFRKMLLDALIRKSLMQLDTSAYPGDVTVFRADDTGGRLLPPDLGWTPFAASVEVFPVKGHHNSLFSTENLPDNAAVFMRALLAATDQDEGMFSTTSRSRAG